MNAIRRTGAALLSATIVYACGGGAAIRPAVVHKVNRNATFWIPARIAERAETPLRGQ